MANDNILGVLGGMGPLASAQYMMRLTLLTPASCDQEHIPTVLWSDPRVPDRTQSKIGGGEDPLPWLLRGIDRLKQAGCGAIAIPCNTAHGWYDEMLAHAELPILHIVDATAADLNRLGLTTCTIGILGTQGTLNMQLYQKRLGKSYVVPTPEEMNCLVTPAIALVKANKPQEAYIPIAKCITALSARGAKAVVLGCTEIPIGVQAGPYTTLGVPLVDTIDALARAAIKWARER
jgi:aspartate racemase